MAGLYEVMERFLPLHGDLEGIYAFAGILFLERELPWHCCDARASRDIRSAKTRDILKLDLPLEVLELSPNIDKDLFQLIDSHADGRKLFLNIGTNLQLLFRPVPVFHINIVSTVGNLPDSTFEVRAIVRDAARQELFDIATSIPVWSTVSKAGSCLAHKAIAEAGTYVSSRSKDKMHCVVQQFSQVRGNCLALPILLRKVASQKERPTRDERKTKKTLRRVAATKVKANKKRPTRDEHSASSKKHKTQKKLRQAAATKVKASKNPIHAAQKKRPAKKSMKRDVSPKTGGSKPATAPKVKVNQKRRNT